MTRESAQSILNTIKENMKKDKGTHRSVYIVKTTGQSSCIFRKTESGEDGEYVIHEGFLEWKESGGNWVTAHYTSFDSIVDIQYHVIR